MIRIESQYSTTSKIKSIGLLLIAVIFILGGINMIASPWTDSVFPIFRNRTFVIAVGIFNAAFGLLATAIFLLQLLGYSLKENIIKFDDSGITDKYRKGSFGHIPWSDIKEVQLKTFQNQRCLTVLVHNPKLYIDRQRTIAERNEAELKYKSTGSPIVIITGLLGPNIDKLKNKIETRLKDVNKRQPLTAHWQ